jgi:superoxide dismutase
VRSSDASEHGLARASASPAEGGALAILQVEKNRKQVLPGWTPALVIDAWEHANYLKYQNCRVGWVDAFMNHLVN